MIDFVEIFKSEPVPKRCKHCDRAFIAKHKSITLCSEECKSDICNAESEVKSLSRFLHCQLGFPRVHNQATIVNFAKGQLGGREELTLAQAGKNTLNAVEGARNYVYGDEWGIVLSSPDSGIGKTRLGLVILAEMARKGVLPSPNLEGIGYFKAVDIAKIMESERFDKEKKLTSALSFSSVLMIDELGFENDKQSQEISALIQEREENQQRTIITTNLDHSRLIEKYGQKLWSRIERSLFTCHGEDWRI